MARIAVVGLLAATLASCAPSTKTLPSVAGRAAASSATVRTASAKPAHAASRWKRTELVLSVGGAAGIAHLGAIEALRLRGHRPHAVIGNSMGALIGGLYAAAPDQDTTAHARSLLAAYAAETRREIGGKAAATGLIGGLLGFMLCGPACALLAGAGGAGATAAKVPRVHSERFLRVLDSYLDHRTIEHLPVEFATYTFMRSGSGLELGVFREGNLAAAIGHSTANAYIFPDIDVRSSTTIDPGVDRLLAVPIFDRCKELERRGEMDNTVIIAINVTGRPAITDGVRCLYMEVRIDTGPVDVADAFAGGAEFDRLVALGGATTYALLAQRLPDDNVIFEERPRLR